MTSYLFGNPNGQQKTPPATALRVQSSVQGQPRAIGWGQGRLSGNLLDFIDFTHTGGADAGKGSAIGSAVGKSGQAQVSYSVAVAISICEGPIVNVLQVWNNATPTPLSTLNLSVFAGGYAQGPWGYMSALHPGHDLNYRGLAYVAAGPLQLGSSATLPNLNFEVLFGIQGVIPSQPDVTPVDVIVDYLTNPFYGVGFPAARLGDLSLYKNYSLAAGLLVSPVETQQRAASDFLTQLFTATNSQPVWSGGQLTVVPYGDQTINTGDQTTISETHAIPHMSVTIEAGASPIVVGCPGTFVSDGGVVYSGSNAPLTLWGTSNPPVGTYFRSGNIYVFNSAEVGTAVTITYTFAAVATYVAPIAPIYDLDDDDFRPSSQGGSTLNGPIAAHRVRVADQYNDIKVEYCDRSNDYNPTIVEVQNDALVQQFKLRPKGTQSFHFFALATPAQLSAMLLLGRENIRNTYVFDVGPQFILLDPMDIISITDPYLGLERQWVRIIEIQENADLSLTITAEEYLEGTGHAPLYGPTAPFGLPQNYNANPGNVNAPIIFEPTIDLGGGMEIWVAVSGQNVANWGGCNIYVSTDNVTYAQAPGAVVGPARMGVLTSPLPAIAGGQNTLDTSHTLAVDLTESGGQLASGSDADATALASLCYVDGEFVAYGTSTPTAVDKYNLSFLVRGAYNTSAIMNGTTHNIGAPFARLDAAIFTMPYNQNQIGQTIYVKFASFNTYGLEHQSLASLTPYTYTIVGLAGGTTTLNGFAAVGTTVAGFGGAIIPAIQVSWTAILNHSIVGVVVEFYTDGTDPSHSTQVTFNPAAGIGIITAGIQAGTTYHLRGTIETAPNNILPSAWTAYLTVTVPNTFVLPSGTPPDVPTGLTLVNVAKVQADGTIIAGVAASWSDDSVNPIFAYYNAQISVDATATWTGTNIGVNQYEWDNIVVGSNVYVHIATVSKLGAQSPFCLPVEIVVTGTNTPPEGPSGLTVQAAFQTVFLHWTNPPNPDLAYIEIWQAPSNNLGAAHLAGTTAGTSFALSGLTTDTQYFFWVRAVNSSGQQGPFNAGATSGTAVTTLQIGTTDVTPNAITTPLLAAGSVLTDQLGAGVITAGKMAANSITAGNAALAVATVGTANIQNLAVNSLQIAGNAVTVPAVDTRGDVISGTGNITISSLTLNVDTTGLAGLPITIVAWFMAQTSQNTVGITWSLDIDGVQVLNVSSFTYSAFMALVGSLTVTATGGFMSIPVAVVAAQGAFTNISTRTLVAQVAKR